MISLDRFGHFPSSSSFRSDCPDVLKNDRSETHSIRFVVFVYFFWRSGNVLEGQ